MGDKGTLKLFATFDHTSHYALSEVTLVQYFPDKQASVKAVLQNGNIDVYTSEIGGSSSKTSDSGDFSSLNGLIRYSVNTWLNEGTIKFVVNDNISIDVVEYALFPSRKPIISVRQSSTSTSGLCASP